MVTSAPAVPSNSTFLDGSDSSATLELFRAALGPLHTDYYLKVFTRFDAADRPGLSWNWAAGLLTLNWMALRKLWSPALTYAGAVLTCLVLVLGAGRLVFDITPEVQTLILAGLALVAIAVPAMLGNALLYSACRRQMEHALEANATLADACAMLKRAAPSRQRMIGLLIGNCVALAAVLGAVVNFPDSVSLGSKTQEMAIARNAVTGKTQEMAAPGLPLLTAAAPPHAVASTPAVIPSVPATSSSAPINSSALPRLQAELPAPVASVPLALSNSPSNKLPNADSPSTPTAKPSQPVLPTASVLKIPENNASVTKKPASKTEHHKPADQSAHFIINVGLFADENNARNAYIKLSDAGLNVLSNEITTKSGKRTRVRAGPFPTMVEAERAAEQIRALNLEAVIAPQ
jgi:cell division septation protein DedD